MLPPALTGTFIRRQGCPHHESEIIAQPDLSLPHSSQNTSQNAFLHTFQTGRFLVRCRPMAGLARVVELHVAEGSFSGGRNT